jgi:hypothetical protein
MSQETLRRLALAGERFVEDGAGRLTLLALEGRSCHAGED